MTLNELKSEARVLAESALPRYIKPKNREGLIKSLSNCIVRLALLYKAGKKIA